MQEWRIKALELANCNCNFGCPCQFSQLPSDGTCEAAAGFEVLEGHHGDVDLAGVKAAGIYKWPGAIHEGGGHMQLIIDDSASPRQRKAMEAIMKGEDTREMATMWYIFSAMSPNKHPTIFAPIHIAYDEESGTGSVKVEGVLETEVRPIPNILSGEPHRISIVLPQGFEFEEALMASGSTRTTGGDLELLKNNASHAHVARLHLSGEGVVRT